MKDRGTDTVLRLKEGMDNYEAAVRAAARVPAQAWARVPLPKRRPREARPLRRDILGLPDQPGWETLGLPLALCLVRDTYPEKVVYWLLMSTDPEQSAREIYSLFGRRWGIEENFMALARYHGVNAIQACRDGLALARLHFTLLAYTLRQLCRGVHSAETLPRTRWLLVSWAGCYALLHASEVFAQVFAHWEEWQGRQAEILEALRYCEGG